MAKTAVALGVLPCYNISMKNFKIGLLLLILLIALPLSACSGGAGATVRYDILSDPKNLDPQYANSEEAKLIIRNTLEGLFRVNERGEAVPAAAESYSVSQDSLTWTITLRGGLLWEDETPLVAGDFAFALRRLFSPEFPSPFAGDFGCIKNSAEVLSGELPQSALGVTASDARTLVISLSYPAPYLPQLLATTAAMPCNEVFYTKARGRYGLSQSMLLANGPFVLYDWDSIGKTPYVQIRKNSLYRAPDEVFPSRVTFYIKSTPEQLERFSDGKTDAAVLSYEQLTSLGEKRYEYSKFEDTVWVLMLNQRVPFLQSRSARTALCQSIDHRTFSPTLDTDLVDSNTFLPPSMRLFGESYRALAGFVREDTFAPENARSQIKIAVAGGEAPEVLTIITDSSSTHPLTAAEVQKSWRDNLSLNVNLVQYDSDELTAKVLAGDYEVALLPLRPSSSRAADMLGQFRSTSEQNIAGYSSPEYDALLDGLSRAGSLESQLAAIRRCEELLYSDGVIIPMYFQTHYYVQGRGVSGISFSPFAGDIDFRGVKK